MKGAYSKRSVCPIDTLPYFCLAPWPGGDYVTSFWAKKLFAFLSFVVVVTVGGYLYRKKSPTLMWNSQRDPVSPRFWAYCELPPGTHHHTLGVRARQRANNTQIPTLWLVPSHLFWFCKAGSLNEMTHWSDFTQALFDSACTNKGGV